MAVYTEVPDDDLRTFLSAYDIGDVVSFKGIAEGVSNSNYLMQTTKGPYILTLYERRINIEELPFFLGLMEHLAKNGVRCPIPIKNKKGEALQTLCGKAAVVVSFLQGISPRKITAEQCAELGTALAQLHEAGRSFGMTRANSLSLDGWRDLYARAGGAADDVEPGMKALIGTELDVLAAAWPKSGLPAGIIHADLFPDNVFFLDGKCSGLIDFYFACTDFLAYDIAVCLNAWCFEQDGAFNITKASRLLGSYSAVRTLTAAEKENLPLFCRGSAMRFLLTRLFDWVNTPAGALVKRKDPREYLQKLNFHRRVESIAAYGLA